jgi:putative transposase
MEGRLMMEVSMSAIPLRTDYDAADARALARKATEPDQVRRLLAIAAVYDGMNRAKAAAVGGMDRQSLRDWVLRFNADGPEGLHDRKPPGAAPKLTAAEKAELAALVEAGPDRQADGVVRWRRIDLKEVIRDRFGVDYHERSVSRLLHELGFSHMSARPRHPGQDPEMLETFKKTSPARSPRR